jgi:hypothetical protein
MSAPQPLPVFSDPIKTAPGFFKLRLVKGGPEVPARLWREEERDDLGRLVADVRYFAEIDGEPCDPANPPRWPWTRIEEPAWRYLTDLGAWARQHAPNDPQANPMLPVRLATVELY